MTRLDTQAALNLPAERSSLVSVIVPTFNRAALLKAAITSVLCQSWPDLEVVVVDDGSRDHTRSVVTAMADEDSRVRYFEQPNGGVSAARNTAMSHARGGMIAFLDSDDAWLPWKLKAQVGVLNALPQVGMVWSDMIAVDPQGQILFDRYLRRMYKSYERIEGDALFNEVSSLGQLVPLADAELQQTTVSWGKIYSRMLAGNLVHTSTVLLRRELAAQVGQFDESMRQGGEDYRFHLQTSRLSAVAFLDASSIHYRIGAEDQITVAGNQVHFARAFLATLEEELHQHAAQTGLTAAEISEIRAEAHDWLAASLIEEGERVQAAVHALKSIREQMLRPTAWKTLAKTLLPRKAVDLVRSMRPSREKGDATLIMKTA